MRLLEQVPCAPQEVQHFGRRIIFWSMVIDKKSQKTISSCKIARKAKKIIVNYMHHPMEAIKHMQVTVWKDYKCVKPTAKKKKFPREKSSVL